MVWGESARAYGAFFFLCVLSVMSSPKNCAKGTGEIEGKAVARQLWVLGSYYPYKIIGVF